MCWSYSWNNHHFIFAYIVYFTVDFYWNLQLNYQNSYYGLHMMINRIYLLPLWQYAATGGQQGWQLSMRCV
eukprot:UN27243